MAKFYRYSNSYEAKDMIKSNGGKYDAATKSWIVPEEGHLVLQGALARFEANAFTRGHRRTRDALRLCVVAEIESEGTKTDSEA